MNNEEMQEVLDELHSVRPEMLNGKGKKLFEAIMKIADERDKYKSIIKEAREYIDKSDLMYLASKCSIVYRDNIEAVAIYDRLKELLEILDKGESNE